MSRVELPRTLAIRLLHEALKAPDREVCGLIAARGSLPTRIIPVSNAATNPTRLFEMDERELIDAMKGIRESGEELFAIYHSHPDALPVPSDEDVRRAGYPEKLHLIISLQTKGVLQMRGWHFANGEAEAVDVGVADGT
ncbi:MAG: M67 family metallopeptidase [Proteobacteria bacterium]|nr:M67 family metallopeptidase [Pseudomonadota bacterium]